MHLSRLMLQVYNYQSFGVYLLNKAIKISRKVCMVMLFIFLLHGSSNMYKTFNPVFLQSLSLFWCCCIYREYIKKFGCSSMLGCHAVFVIVPFLPGNILSACCSDWSPSCVDCLMVRAVVSYSHFSLSPVS